MHNPKRAMPDFSADDLAEITRRRASGTAVAELAEKFGTSSMTIRKIYQVEIFS